MTRFYSRLTFLAFTLAFVVILLGAYTRLTNAGLSCPDWPRCYGYITPPSTHEQLQVASAAYPQVPVDSTKAWTEMRHRYLAGIEGILILMIVTLAWYNRKQLPPLVFKLSQSLIGIMFCQILLGMLTVTALLKPVVVLGHLVLGFSVMSVLWVMWLLMQTNNLPPIKKRGWGGFPLILGLFILILQIILGGWVSTHSAGLACIDFPYCNGTLIPTLHWDALNSDLITIHMLHRIGALITFLTLSMLSIYLMMQKNMRGFGITIMLLLCTQVILGILNIIWLRPVDIALPHHAIAAILLLTLLALIIKFYRLGLNHD